jgi:hypothetical protein
LISSSLQEYRASQHKLLSVKALSSILTLASTAKILLSDVLKLG